MHTFLSPASGKVFSITHSFDQTIPINKNHKKVLNFLIDELGHHPAGYHIISIMMTPRDVHIQRSPTQAKTISVSYRPWIFLNAISYITRQKAIWENEAQTIIMERPLGDRYAVIQIAWFMARKIISYTKKGVEHKPGEPIGFITLGSQVTVVIPWSYQITTQIWQYVRDGESILALMNI